MNTAEILNFPKEEAPVMKAELEDGYFPVANMLIEAMAMGDFSKREYKILLATMRKTYGFHKSTDQIALSQYAKLTGMDTAAVSRALAELVAKNVLIKSNSRFDASYKINTVVSSWILDRKAERVYKERTNQIANCQNDNSKDANCQNDNSELSNQQIRIVKTTTTKDNSKNNSKHKETEYQVDNPDSGESGSQINESVSEVVLYGTPKRGKRCLSGKRLAAFNLFWEAFDLKKGKAEAIDAWLDIPQLTGNLVKQIVEAARREAISRGEIISKGGTPKWAQGWINSRRWEDEDYQVNEFTTEQKVVVDAFNKQCGAKYGSVRTWIASRAAAINSILNEKIVDDWDDFFAWVAHQEIPGTIGFDWFMKKENLAKVKEGVYE